VRDIYTNDVEEVLVEGEEAYKTAKAQMKMLIPSHAKRVVKYEESTHLFQAHNVEPQLDTIHHNEVTLKSGGYLVINQTEALVAIDVNSGKATRERNIEETALKTNLEAAEEVGRQLKLRDLSGLIVIDFIDMDENRNQNAVERRLKDALRHDRARIQVGSISHFGLLEMSRQRLRPSLVESVSQSCPHCLGTGRVRSVNSSALQMLRIIEEEAARQAGRDITIFVHPEVALYILNQKRASLAQLESQFGITILVEADTSLLPSEHRFDGQRQDNQRNERSDRQNNRHRHQNQNQNQNQNNNQDRNATSGPPSSEDEDEDQPKRRRRGKRGGRRRKRRGGEEDNQLNDQQLAENNNQDRTETAADIEAAENTEEQSQSEGKKPRRSRKRRRPSDEAGQSQETSPAITADESAAEPVEAEAQSGENTSPKTKKAAKKSTKKAAKTGKSAKAKAEKPAASDSEDETATKSKAVKKKAKTAKKAAKAGKSAKSKTADAPGEPSADTSTERASASSVEIKVVNIDDGDVPKTKKGGWWSR